MQTLKKLPKAAPNIPNKTMTGACNKLILVSLLATGPIVVQKHITP